MEGLFKSRHFLPSWLSLTVLDRCYRETHLYGELKLADGIDFDIWFRG